MTEQHVLPAADLIAHETNDDCPCGPTTAPVGRADGSVGWVVIHYSLDGRKNSQWT